MPSIVDFLYRKTLLFTPFTEIYKNFEAPLPWLPVQGRSIKFG
jgi:hypothetical protein